ncbi:MAG: flagellar assembly protein FliW [Proteobacteria bacterium]|nr:flagellar assembly protein FliW [Pseudomonadota bacterium]MBU1612411.1 flagellar assembly protein FliW [Pseudomonadota bacterium]
MAEEGKRVIRTRLGEREISEEGIIRFPRGLIGYEDKREFVLIQMADDSPFLLLQSLDDPALGLLVADPYPFLADYQVKLEEIEERLLGAKRPEDIAVLVTVTIPKNEPQKTTLNLTGPIVMNTEARIGLQVPQVDATYPPRFRLVDGGA